MLLFAVSPAQIFDQKGFDLLSGSLKSPKPLTERSCLASSLLFSLQSQKVVGADEMFCSSVSLAQIFD
jgi:hypothetical protein